MTSDDIADLFASAKTSASESGRNANEVKLCLLPGKQACPAVFDEGFYEGRYALSTAALRVSCSS